MPQAAGPRAGSRSWSRSGTASNEHSPVPPDVWSAVAIIDDDANAAAVLAHLVSLGYSGRPLPCRAGAETADLEASRDGHSLVVEVKTRHPTTAFTLRWSSEFATQVVEPAKWARDHLAKASRQTSASTSDEKIRVGWIRCLLDGPGHRGDAAVVRATLLGTQKYYFDEKSLEVYGVHEPSFGELAVVIIEEGARRQAVLNPAATPEARASVLATELVQACEVFDAAGKQIPDGLTVPSNARELARKYHAERQKHCAAGVTTKPPTTRLREVQYALSQLYGDRVGSWITESVTDYVLAVD